MRNHINEIFETFSPKEEQKTKMFHKILNEQDNKKVNKRKSFRSWKGFLRPAIACILCLLIITGVFTFGGGENSFVVYAYGENIEITNTGVEISTGDIHNDGSMKGQLMQMYVKGENIETIRFSCKNQHIDFTDWTESRENFSMKKQFDVHYGKKSSEYGYLVVNWSPENTIRQLTDISNSSISKLSQDLKNDIILVEATFFDGKKETKAIDINLDDNGKIHAKLIDYKGSKDDFLVNTHKSLPIQTQTKNNTVEETKNINYSQEEIKNAKEVAKKYYLGINLANKIDSIEYTENSQLLSSGIPDKYKGWSLIAFKAHEKSMDSNILRNIILAKEKDKNEWIVINEGY